MTLMSAQCPHRDATRQLYACLVVDLERWQLVLEKLGTINTVTSWKVIEELRQARLPYQKMQ